MRVEADLVIDFWEVGQADCTVIRLPDDRLFIIDVGRIGSPLIDWLADRSPRPQIAAIVLTHNDSDHAGALPAVLDLLGRNVEAVWMLRDRPSALKPFANIFRRVAVEESKGLIVRRLEDPAVLWENPALGLRIHVGYPTFTANESARRANDTSGLILLEHDGDLLCAWPGDLPVHVVADRVSPRRPHLLHGPHHGAPTDFKGPHRDRYRSGVASLSPNLGFISVGSKNSYNHPRRGYLLLLAHQGCRVVCSQITNACDRNHFRDGIPVFEGSGALGLRAARSGTPCRGAWRIRIRAGELEIDEFSQAHLARVANLQRPLCLRGRGWKSGDPLPW
jgi:beta-lactamase superfamily II metal-dependent hydrolase